MPEYQLCSVHPSVFRFIFMSNKFRSAWSSFSQKTFMISNSVSRSFRDSFMFLSLPSTNILHLSKMIVNLILDVCLIFFVSSPPCQQTLFLFFTQKKTAPGKAQPFLPWKQGRVFIGIMIIIYKRRGKTILFLYSEKRKIFWILSCTPWMPPFLMTVL